MQSCHRLSIRTTTTCSAARCVRRVTASRLATYMDGEASTATVEATLFPTAAIVQDSATPSRLVSRMNARRQSS
eukprot:426894-Rhodomonas_salina.1